MPVRMSSHDLVGRAAELDGLTAALGDALAGTPTTVLVGGEAGSGKTRLVTRPPTGSRRTPGCWSASACN